VSLTPPLQVVMASASPALTVVLLCLCVSRSGALREQGEVLDSVGYGEKLAETGTASLRNHELIQAPPHKVLPLTKLAETNASMSMNSRVQTGPLGVLADTGASLRDHDAVKEPAEKMAPLLGLTESASVQQHEQKQNTSGQLCAVDAMTANLNTFAASATQTLKNSKTYSGPATTVAIIFSLICLVGSILVLVYGNKVIEACVLLALGLAAFSLTMTIIREFTSACTWPAVVAIILGVAAAVAAKWFLELAFIAVGLVLGAFVAIKLEDVVLAITPVDAQSTLMKFWFVVIIAFALLGYWVLQRFEWLGFTLISVTLGSVLFELSVGNLWFAATGDHLGQGFLLIILLAAFGTGLFMQLHFFGEKTPAPAEDDA
jgi:hypothetical protein